MRVTRNQLETLLKTMSKRFKLINELTEKTSELPAAQAYGLAKSLFQNSNELIEEWKHSRALPSNWVQGLLLAASRTDKRIYRQSVFL